MRLPPLNALRAFEAAARHGGYIAAAEEMHVTRGAVSRHVKVLEDHLGVSLFRRHSSGVELTRAGEALLPVLTEAFQSISEGVRRLSEAEETLRIICPPAISIRWLLPRLADFRAKHPDVRLSLTTDFYGERGFDGIDYDLGFSVERATRTRAPGIRVEPLFPFVVCPACAPSFLERAGPFKTPSDFRDLPLLLEGGYSTDWTQWQDHFKIPGLDVRQGTAFPNFDLVTKAAVMGEGLILADFALCQEELTSGELVLPFPEMRFEMPQGWYSLIGGPERWDDPAVAAFRIWVAEQAAAFRSVAFPGNA